MPDHSSPPADPPLSVGRALRELRELMYAEGRGTWFSLRYTVDPPAAFHVVYNHDFGPKWSPDLSPREWALDLEHFPRAPEHVPEWLRAKLPDDDQPTADTEAMAEPLNPVQQDELLQRIIGRLVLELPAG